MFLGSPIASPVKTTRRGSFSTPDRVFASGIHLNFASGIHYVKASGAVPTVSALTSLFTFTGGNQSMYMGPAGLLVASATNTPRIEYDANGNCLGLLMEAARTNLALHSSDGTNAAWTKSNCTAAKTATGPDGVSNSATTLTATAGNATCLQVVTSASAQRTHSIWLKRRTGTGNIDMTVDGGTGWTTKTITSSWARYSITQSAVTNPSFGLRIVTSGDVVDFYGDQLESAPFMSSTIPTTTAGVARTADVCSRVLGSEFSATAGTVCVRGKHPGGDSTSRQPVFSFDDGTANNRIPFVRPGSSNQLQLRVDSGGVNQSASGDTVTNSATFKAAGAWVANDLAFVLNSGIVQTDASVTIPTVTTLGLGYESGSALQMNGHILTFDYWPERKHNGELVRLASGG